MSNNTYLSINKHDKIALAFIWFITLCAWGGLLIQFYVTITTYNPDRTLPGVLVQFISYFTIICNALAAISITWLLVKPAPGSYFSRNTVLSAITFYMIIVGIIYNAVLRSLIPLNGLAFIANEILHVATPLLYVLFWLALVPKTGLLFTDALKWLWLPFIYLIYILIRGAICGLYPYPFMNVAEFGYTQIAFNSVVLLFVFLGLGMLFIGMARLMAKRQKT